MKRCSKAKMVVIAAATVSLSCTASVDGGAAAKRAEIEKIAFILCTGTQENERCLEIYDYFTTVDPNPLAALGWLMYGAVSGDAHVRWVLEGRKQQLLNEIKGGFPVQIYRYAESVTKDQSPSENANHIAAFLDKKGVIGAGALGWSLYGTVLGNEESFKPVFRYRERYKGADR